MGNNNNKSNKDETEKKSTPPWERIMSSQVRLLQVGLVKNTLIWLFLLISVYSIYCTFFHNDRHDCRTVTNLPVDSSIKAPLRTLANVSSSNTDRFQVRNQDVREGEDDDDDDDEVDRKVFDRRQDTEVKHIVFCVAASANLWRKRKEYVKIWWRENETRAVVWMDEKVKAERGEDVPEIRISSDTSKFKYTHGMGMRSALRISRAVSETLRLDMKDVRWFVMGDDDTVFLPENVAKVLSKYDHRQFYYIGSSSESHIQNMHFSYSMAFGGGGFALSYPLAEELETMQDRCIQRYPDLYGSDDRIHACMSELGVPLTKEIGFHQYDVHGDLVGLLGAHPVTPLLSLHHLDLIAPVFPHMTQVKALQHLFQSVKLDSASVMQQSICYDKQRHWSVSVSWGYVVQVVRGVILPRDLETPSRTFYNWWKRADYTTYSFNTRPISRHPCQRPFIYYMSTVRYDQASKQTIGVYVRDRTPSPLCRWKMHSPEKVDSIVVFKRPDPLRWKKSQRRDCCRILPPNKSSTMYISVGPCQQGEVSEVAKH